MKFGRFEAIVLGLTVAGLVVMFVVLATVPVTRVSEFSVGGGATGYGLGGCGSPFYTFPSPQELPNGGNVSFHWATQSPSTTANVTIIDSQGRTVYTATGSDGMGTFTSTGGTYSFDLTLCNSGNVTLWGNITTSTPSL
ncbi:MAG: hypothetical protein ABSE66_07225 [Thermoplasmata archaeon]|jgi:hypothetical protein